MISENNKFIKPLEEAEKTYILMCNCELYKIYGKIAVLKKMDNDSLGIAIYCYYDQAAYPNFTYEYYLEEDTEINENGYRVVNGTNKILTERILRFDDKTKQHNIVTFSGRRGIYKADCVYVGDLQDQEICYSINNKEKISYETKIKKT